MGTDHKEKLIRVLQILEETDEKSPMNATQILKYLEEEYQIEQVDRRSVYRDIKMLQFCGYEIYQCADKKMGWYMKNIYFRNGVLIYYGNPAGYLSDGKVILDSIFDKGEIKEFLSEKENLAVEVREGVYDRLSEGGGMEKVKLQGRERRIKIHQLKQGSPLMMRFISLAERENRGYGKPQAEEYALVYEGEVENFSLEEVWEKFGRRVPKDFEGHALSISDVVELIEDEASRFFYVEPKGFAEIVFQSE